MKKQQSILVFTIITIIILGPILSCAPQRRISGNYTFRTECVGVEGDGSMTLLSWGAGRNRFDAIEQAKKNAVRDVLFRGITGGKSGCEVRPLVSVVNAEEKHEKYFATFFRDGGEYLNFVDQRDEKYKDKIKRFRQEGRRDRTFSVVVNVDRLKLKEILTRDSIL
jgi:hypothetical protein